MRTLLFIFYFLMVSHAKAQNRDEVVDVDPEYKSLFNEYDDCYEHQEQNCVEILNKIIEKGKQEKVAFLDYLYGRKAFHFWNIQELDSTMVYAQLAVENLNPEEKQ